MFVLACWPTVLLDSIPFPTAQLLSVDAGCRMPQLPIANSLRQADPRHWERLLTLEATSLRFGPLLAGGVPGSRMQHDCHLWGGSRSWPHPPCQGC